MTLVTASALLDLMPADWIAALATRLADAGVPFYAALSYDGIMTWDPALPARCGTSRGRSTTISAGDKGLGPALGPDAAVTATQIFRDAGFDVHTGQKPVAERPRSGPLHRALVQGIAEAASETGLSVATDWGRSRIAMAGDSRCLIAGIMTCWPCPPARA